MPQEKVFIDNNNMKKLVGAIREIKTNKQAMENIDTFDSQKYYVASKYIKNAINLVGGDNNENNEYVKSLENIYKHFNICAVYYKCNMCPGMKWNNS
jgi:predicted DNA-binding helix-hairpin-helix protein